jgi:hypothetical protein
MSRARVGIGVLVVVAALAVAAVPGGAMPERAAKTFSTYAACEKSSKKADRFCFAGVKPAAILRANRRDGVHYRVCLRGGGKPKCKEKTTRREGKLSRIRFGKQSKGKYYFVWFVNGRKVDRDGLLVHKRAVFHVGDSLGVGTEPYLPQALNDWKVEQSVKVARHGFEAVSILRNRGGLPGAIVMSIGGNDDPNNVGGFRDTVAKTVQIAGPNRCVVWPNHFATKEVNGGNFEGYNNVLADFEKRNRNFRIVNWVAIARAHPGWMAPDGIHVNATGYQARARAIAKQVRNC